MALVLEAAKSKHFPERDSAIVMLALSCALRKDELRGLQWPRDIDLKRGIISVQEAKTEAGIRQVPLSARAVALLDAYINDWRPARGPGALFLNKHGDAFTYYGFDQIFRRIKKKLPASLDFKIHRARNTALTNWRRVGVDVATIAKLAGHSDIAHTDRYLGDITPAEITAVPDAFSRIYGRRAG